MKLHPILFPLAFLGLAAPLQAAEDLDNIGNLSQSEFRLLSEDLGSALSYKSLAPAEPLGLLGFDVGLAITATDLQHSDVWRRATLSNDAPDTLIVPKLQIQKGLPFGFDIGAFYTSVPDTNIRLLGGQLSYAIMEGGMAMPALALRGTYSRLSGVDELELDTTGVELAISKGVAIFTPYAGIGRVWTDSAPSAGTNLAGENFHQNKYFLGTNVNFVLFDLSFEIDETDDVTSYSGKLGLRF